MNLGSLIGSQNPHGIQGCLLSQEGKSPIVDSGPKVLHRLLL